MNLGPTLESWAQLAVIIGTLILGLFKIGKWFGRLESRLERHGDDLAIIFQYLGLPRQPTREYEQRQQRGGFREWWLHGRRPR